MKFSNKQFLNYIKFFREVAVVVIGVAITLAGTLWITSKNEKRDMKLYLNAIKIELEENIKEFEDAKNYAQSMVGYSNYVRSSKGELLNKDSLNFYAQSFTQLMKYSFKSNAFEMFKSSGVMRLMDDKDLMLTIWDTYIQISLLKEVLDWSFQTKWEELKVFLDIMKENSEYDLSAKAPLYNYFMIGIPHGMLLASNEAINASKATIEKLNKILKIKPQEIEEEISPPKNEIIDNLEVVEK